MSRTVLITPTWQVSMWNKTARLSESIAEALTLLDRDVIVITPQIYGGARRRWVDGIHIMEVEDNPRGEWIKNAKQAYQSLRGITEAIVIDSAAWQVAKDTIQGNIPVLAIAIYGQAIQGERIASVRTDKLIDEENDMIANADKVLVNNEILRERLIQTFTRDIDKLEMAASTAPEVDTVMEQANGAPKREGEVVVVGKIGPELGVEKVMRVMPDLPWLKLNVIGMPRSEWEQNRVNLLINRLNIEDRVKFSGWARTRDVLSAIHNAEMLVAPSQVEYYGYSAMDGMCMNTPVIASTANVHLEIIQDAETGMLFQNQEELKYALSTLHDMEPLRKQFVDKASWSMKNERTINRMAESLAAVMN